MPTIDPGTPAAVIAWLTAESSRCATASSTGFAASDEAGAAVVDNWGDPDSPAHPEAANSTVVTAKAITGALIASQVMRMRC